MNIETLRACSKDKLASMARRQGIAGWHGMTKDALVKALVKAAAKSHANGARKATRTKSRGTHTHQRAAARNTSSTSSAEEQVERS